MSYECLGYGRAECQFHMTGGVFLVVTLGKICVRVGGECNVFGLSWYKIPWLGFLSSSRRDSVMWNGAVSGILCGGIRARLQIIYPLLCCGQGNEGLR